MFCPNCGAQLPDGSKFCGNCGARLGGAQDAAPQQPQQQYAPAAAYETKERPSVMLYMGLAVLAVIIGVIAFFVVSSMREDDPLQGAKLKRQKVWEANGLTVTVTGLSYNDRDGEYPYEVELELKNSGAQDMTVQCTAAAVNDIKVDTVMSTDVPAGSSVKDTLDISERSVSNRIGLEKFATIDFVLNAFETNTYEGDIWSDRIHLKTGLKQPTANLATKGEVFYDQNGIKLVYRTIYPLYQESGPGLEFYVENHTNAIIAFLGQDVSVNGVSVGYSYFLTDFYLPGTVGYSILELYTDDLEALGVLPMSDVSLTVVFIDPYTFEPIFEIPLTIPRL